MCIRDSLRTLRTGKRRVRHFLRVRFVVPMKIRTVRFLYRVGILLQVFTWRFWKQHPRVLITILFIPISAGLAAYQIHTLQLEKQKFLYYPDSWVFRTSPRETLHSADGTIDGPQGQSVGGGSL